MASIRIPAGRIRFRCWLMSSRKCPLVCSLFLFGYVPAVVSLLIGLSINIKRFFLHEMYRNRLVRAFLGASNTRSTQRDLFTFFNFTACGSAKKSVRRPHPFIECQAGEAAKGLASLPCPQHRAQSTSEYGGKERITLGTAMAISGAAVSPNMGYNSSPLITFLLTLVQCPPRLVAR